MKNYQTEAIVSSLIDLIYQQVNRGININKLLTNIPQFNSNMFMQIVQESRLAAQVQCQINPSFIEEENMMNVNHIQKDSLMPKQLSQEKLRIKSPKKQSPKQSASSARKILGLKKKESSSIVDRIQSIPFNDNKTNKTKSTYVALKKQQQVQPQQLQTKHLRQRTQNRLNQLQKQKNWMKTREEKFRQKLQVYQNLIEEKKDISVTYDYQGDALKSKIVDDKEKVELKMMKTGVGFTSKKFKEGYQVITDSEHREIQVSKNIMKSKAQTYSAIKASNIPLFPMKPILPQDQKNLKLEQYRKFYDFKYSRTGFGHRNTQTTKTTIQDNQQDAINQNKVIKQSEKIETLKKAMRTLDNQRKIALPRLHGKYKVLDRYEQP